MFCSSIISYACTSPPLQRPIYPSALPKADEIKLEAENGEGELMIGRYKLLEKQENVASGVHGC